MHRRTLFFMEPESVKEVAKLHKNTTLLQQNLTLAFKVIERLSGVFKGNYKDLDHKMADLRKGIKQSEDFTDLGDQITNVTTTVNEFENAFAQLLRDLKTQLLMTGEELQSIKGMDSELRRKLRMVLNKLKATDSSLIFDVQPVIVNLLAIACSINNTGTIDSSGASVMEDDASENYNASMMTKLVEGLRVLSKSEVIKPSLNEFDDRVSLAKTDGQKMDLCLSFFDNVVARFTEEYSQTQKLILGINKALAEVHLTLLESLKSSKAFDVKLKSLNNQIDQQINELSASTNNANSVEELQKLIDVKLVVINESIKQRDEIENQRSLKLQDTLKAMESRLGGLEQRTEYYRKKWLDEKVRNGIDTLTGLPNRGAYDTKIQEEYQRWLRQPQPLTIAVIDIDRFKKINDTFGHSVGDKTLKIVAKTLKKHLRATDFLSRYGGEEFVAIMLNSNPDDVAGPLEKLRLAVEKIPFKVKDTPLNITISIGYTAFLAADNVHTAFDRADKALYKAKHTGRNRVCFK